MQQQLHLQIVTQVLLQQEQISSSEPSEPSEPSEKKVLRIKLRKNSEKKKQNKS